MIARKKPNKRESSKNNLPFLSVSHKLKYVKFQSNFMVWNINTFFFFPEQWSHPQRIGAPFIVSREATQARDLKVLFFLFTYVREVGRRQNHQISPTELSKTLNFFGGDMGVSENGGTPKLSILIGFSIINHPFWGTSIFGNTHIGDGTPNKIWAGTIFFCRGIQHVRNGAVMGPRTVGYTGFIYWLISYTLFTSGDWVGSQIMVGISHLKHVQLGKRPCIDEKISTYPKLWKRKQWTLFKPGPSTSLRDLGL